MFSPKKHLPPSLYELQELKTAGAKALILQALATGIASGLVIGLFRMAYTACNHFLASLWGQGSHDACDIALAAGIILFCAVIAWLALRHEPLISGSGIPHVELVLRGKLPMPWRRVLWTKFVGTLASLSGGLSVGREGPCIQMGAAVGCGVGALWHDDHLRPRYLVGGSTAGMTAAFGAPLAGMFFAFEEMKTLVTLPLLLFTGLAAMGAWFMVDVVLGLGLVFPLADTRLALSCCWLAPLAGLAMGLLSAAYNRLLVATVMAADRSGIAQPWRLLPAFAAGFVLLLAFPEIMTGLGPGITELAHGSFPLLFLLALCTVKILFNFFSFASGVAGGILMPMLLAGGFCGALLACALQGAGLAAGETQALVVLGMAGLFAGTVRAPLTGAFLITEMTGAWALLPALLVVSFTAGWVATRLHTKPVYDSLRARQLLNYRKSQAALAHAAAAGRG